MSMTMLIVLQFMGVLAAYLITALFLPWILLRRRLGGLRLSARLMACFMAGNFYIMNLVFLLQLLHISFRGTLLLGTVLPFAAAGLHRYRGRIAFHAERFTGRARTLSEGEMGRKTFLLRAGRALRNFSSERLKVWLAFHKVDILLMSGVLALILYIYGLNTFQVYGYSSSDMVLHNYWINHMGNNNLFVDGIYPFGFHCVIYYLHQVFAFPTYMLLHVFSLVQTIMIHFMLFLFLRSVCRARYTPYIGIFAYVASDIFYQYVYYRYYAALPQEFGMLFLLPAAYFAIAFLQERGIAAGFGRKKGEPALTTIYLLFFTLSISMTLSAHFYDTMMTGLFCIGIGIGFCFRCLRWRYLKRLLLAGAAGILLAALPMGIAYATGTPLQGSLHWGMGLISAVESEDSASGNNTENTENEKKTESGTKNAQNTDSADKRQQISFRESLGRILEKIEECNTSGNVPATRFILGSIGALFLLGILWFFLGRREYGAVLISVSLFAVLLCVLQSAAQLGIPQIMEYTRYAVYIGYVIAVSWSLCLDAIMYLLFRERRSIEYGALTALVLAGVLVAYTGIKTPVRISPYESNEAVLCLTNIIMEENRSREQGGSGKEGQSDTNAGGTWTICSANDERQMLWDYGYHFETIRFLQQMEDIDEETILTIPTDTVYFFVEKVPLLYLDYMNTVVPERTVSAEGAKKPLPKLTGLESYIGDARWIVMSHMYYWTQEFMRLYPNEMEVYYETENFVCYRIRQNGYSPYNFAIDYGYN